MAYCIDERDPSLQDSLRRIAAEQIDQARNELNNAELDFAMQVHQVRKRCKKLRGLIRLVRPAFNNYRGENAAFRDAARLLSAVRDSRTMIDTYDLVTTHFEHRIDRRAFASIRARLTRDARGVRHNPETAARMQTFRREMEAARERISTWTLDRTGFDAIANGAGKTYGQARSRMKSARSERDDELLHEWRKRVKEHGYHTRLLSTIFPVMMNAQAVVASELSDLLGAHHDLVVLDARLDMAPNRFGRETDIQAFRALLHIRKSELAEAAFSLGQLVLAEHRSALIGRWRAYWEAWIASTSGREQYALAKPARFS